MLALGDALAVAVSLRKGFRAEDFAELHPGGKLGKQLAKVRELMHTGETCRCRAVDDDGRCDLRDVVEEAGHDDGAGIRAAARRDLGRRLKAAIGARRRRGSGQDGRRGDDAHPRTIAAEELAAKALAILEERKITSLVVVNAEQKVEGVVHLHDLWGVELI